MANENQINFELLDNNTSIIKIIGIGGGGSNAVNYMFSTGIKDVNFVVCNTDKQALQNSPVPNKILLGSSLTEGRGSNNSPEIGRQAALENIDDVLKIFTKNTKMVLIAAGMGGGTGTGAAPVIAKAAKDMGLLTIAIVTLPFRFEGNQRLQQAIQGINELKKNVDSLLIINNEKLREMSGNLKLSQAFSMADNILALATKGIAEIITVQGYINVDFADVKNVITDSGISIMGTALAQGDDRAKKAISEALKSPLLNDNNINEASSIIVNITSGTKEATMDEVGQITDYISNEVNKDTLIIWGTGTDNKMNEGLRVTLIATGFSTNLDKSKSYYKKAEETLKLHFKLDEECLSLFFINNEYSPTEIAEIISHLSDLYKEIGGDELIIKGTNIYEDSMVLQNVLI